MTDFPLINDNCAWKKIISSEVFKKVLTQLNERYNAATGKDFSFVVAQTRNKFKWCVSTCKKSKNAGCIDYRISEANDKD